MPITIPDNAPFTGAQRMWLKGFLDGISSCMLLSTGGETPRSTAPAATPSGLPVTILWGSQTGTAESFAKKLAKSLSAKGHSPTVLDMAATTPAVLASITTLLVITSTYGDGEPPDNAAAFHKDLHAGDVDLSHLEFSVFALGDSNYPDFCKCGRDFHNRLGALGATPLVSLTESDVDHDGPFASWNMIICETISSRVASH